MSKKKPRRSRSKYPALEKRMNTRIRQEYIDMDYIDDLDDTVKDQQLPDGTWVTTREWYNYFMREHNNAAIAKDSIKDKTGEAAKKNKFHRTPEEAKECTDRNNARNNDMYGQAKAQNLMNDMEAGLIDRQQRSYTTEDDLIAILDYAKEPGEASDDTDDQPEDS